MSKAFTKETDQDDDDDAVPADASTSVVEVVRDVEAAIWRDRETERGVDLGLVARSTVAAVARGPGTGGRVDHPVHRPG